MATLKTVLSSTVALLFLIACGWFMLVDLSHKAGEGVANSMLEGYSASNWSEQRVQWLEEHREGAIHSCLWLHRFHDTLLMLGLLDHDLAKGLSASQKEQVFQATEGKLLQSIECAPLRHYLWYKYSQIMIRTDFDPAAFDAVTEMTRALSPFQINDIRLRVKFLSRLPEDDYPYIADTLSADLQSISLYGSRQDKKRFAHLLPTEEGQPLAPR